MSATTTPELHLGTDMPAEMYDAILNAMNDSDMHVEAAISAFEGLRDHYLQMEERPAFNVFAVVMAKALLDWMADACVNEYDFLGCDD